VAALTTEGGGDAPALRGRGQVWAVVQRSVAVAWEEEEESYEAPLATKWWLAR
jgi:hypothetical protein